MIGVQTGAIHGNIYGGDIYPVQVIYLPDQQVSIFVAAEGNALVSPVTGSGSRLTRSIPLAAGQFLYTAPDLVTSLGITGPVTIGDNRQSPVLVPVRVTVTNRGGEKA